MVIPMEDLQILDKETSKESPHFKCFGCSGYHSMYFAFPLHWQMLPDSLHASILVTLGKLSSLNDVVVDQTHQPRRTFATLINKSILELHLSETAQPTNSKKRRLYSLDYRKVYISSLPLVKTRHSPGETRSGCTPARMTIVDVARGKGIELLSYVALTEEAQYEEVRRELRGTSRRSSSGLGYGYQPTPSAVYSISEGSDQEKDSDDDETQSDNENESDSKHETNESGFESDQEEDEEKIEDDEEEEEEEIVKTLSNDSDDEDETKNELVDSDKGFIQEEGTDAAMTNVQQGNENPEILQVIEDAHVTLSTIPQKTEVLVTSSSHSFDLAAKFLNFSDILHTNAEVVSPMDVHVYHEVPSQQTPKLLTVPVSVIADSPPVFSTIIPQSFPSFIPPPQQSTFTPPPTTKATNPSSTLPDFASVFQFNNRHSIGKTKDGSRTFFSTYGKVYALKRSRNDNDEDPLAGSDRGLDSSKGDKSQSKSSGKSVQLEEPEFEVADSELPQLRGEPGLLKGTRSNYAKLEYDFEECYKALSEKLHWENPEGDDYPFDLTKPLPLVMSRNRQKVPVDYFFNNDLKYLQGGIKDMVPDIWVPVEVMRKHGYGYLKEIFVRRADNILYRFKEGDFPRFHTNDIEDMLLFVKRVEDLQLGVESYQKKINVTRPQTTISDIRKRDPYTPYQDPQGFIYVDNNGRNRLMRSYELYMFSDRTLTGLRTSMDDITKNI
ncbi:hypothetical protein Tco_0271796 [Tanacetum coccineum]